MSKIICSAAIRGAYQIVDKADKKLAEAIAQKGAGCKVEFPNTAYYLPIIYSMTGIPVKTLEDCVHVIGLARSMLPPLPAEKHWVPYLGHTLDAGMATLFAEEIYEACKYLIGPTR
ncbi:MAG: hypothetical protein L3J17_07155 [Candidatus Jettenia sp.]|nr:MAG: hypothetical protein L3J17_07155 [Candidatus Jettenia sp.]